MFARKLTPWPLFAPDEGAGGAGTGQAPIPEGQEPEGTTETREPEGERTYTAAEMKAVRDEAAANRVKARETEKRLKELEDANKSEQERLSETAGRVPALESELETLKAENDALRQALTDEVDRQKKELAQEMRDLLPSGSPAEQLAWISKARKVRPQGGLPPAGGRPPGGGNGQERTAPTEQERQAAAQHYATRF